jgi:hypothetical protein
MECARPDPRGRLSSRRRLRRCPAGLDERSRAVAVTAPDGAGDQLPTSILALFLRSTTVEEGQPVVVRPGVGRVAVDTIDSPVWRSVTAWRRYARLIDGSRQTVAEGGIQDHQQEWEVASVRRWCGRGVDGAGGVRPAIVAPSNAAQARPSSHQLRGTGGHRRPQYQQQTRTGVSSFYLQRLRLVSSDAPLALEGSLRLDR